MKFPIFIYVFEHVLNKVTLLKHNGFSCIHPYTSGPDEKLSRCVFGPRAVCFTPLTWSKLVLLASRLRPISCRFCVLLTWFWPILKGTVTRLLKIIVTFIKLSIRCKSVEIGSHCSQFIQLFFLIKASVVLYCIPDMGCGLGSPLSWIGLDWIGSEMFMFMVDWVRLAYFLTQPNPR